VILGAKPTTGRIKRLNDRGFGFIGGSDGHEYFFHRNDMLDSAAFDALRAGDPVEFDSVEPAPAKGHRARHVIVIELDAA